MRTRLLQRKKAQVQMVETVAVLFIFFLIIVIGLVFYTKIAKTNLSFKNEEKIQQEAIQVAQRAAFLPELQCSRENVVMSDNCIDLLKLKVAAGTSSQEGIINLPQNQILYFDRLKFSKISVTEVYPNSEEWVLYDRPLGQFRNKVVTFVPIALFDPLSSSAGKNAFGFMSVELYLP